jgi:hypothetical protein
MKNKHAFENKGYNQLDRKCYVITCSNTGGSFCTTLWDLGKYEKNYCPCCKTRIKK